MRRYGLLYYPWMILLLSWLHYPPPVRPVVQRCHSSWCPCPQTECCSPSTQLCSQLPCLNRCAVRRHPTVRLQLHILLLRVRLPFPCLIRYSLPPLQFRSFLLLSFPHPASLTPLPLPSLSPPIPGRVPAMTSADPVPLPLPKPLVPPPPSALLPAVVLRRTIVELSYAAANYLMCCVVLVLIPP